MRRLFLLAAILAAVAAAPSGGLARTHPTIDVTRLIPLTVTGSGFKAGERVRVVVRSPVVHRKTVTAGRRGRFTAIFRSSAGKCASIHAIATGNKGSRATAYVPPSCGV